MKRREALKLTTTIVGATLSVGTASAILSGCKADAAPDWIPTYFQTDQMDLIAEVAERIIPKTTTPGAKDALVHRYIDEAVKNNYDEKEQAFFNQSLADFDTKSTAKFKKPFVKCKAEEMDAVLEEMANEAKAKKAEDDEAMHIFDMMKGLTIGGFFTSEIGATQVLNYDPIPGEFIGCYDYDKVGATWAL